MTIDLGILLTVFGVAFLVELPDKTMVATLVLSSRYRPLPVLTGVAAAMALQMMLAVAVGRLLTLLPRSVTLSVVAALFAIGAVLLVRESMQDEDESPEDTPAASSWLRIAMISFAVLLLAEFGDGSQLATAALSARYGAPLSVFLGAWLGEMAVCGIAAVAGRALLKVLPVHWLQRAAAALFTFFAILAVVELLRS
jgi:putative Ca2+/H+ antiporter (TMEM165/GDT1 family)